MLEQLLASILTISHIRLGQVTSAMKQKN